MICSTSNIQIETVISRINKNTLNLQPDFQRGEVWSLSKQKKLIDTILREWKIPPIHIVPSDDLLVDEVLDGQQRLVAIRDFCDGKFTIDGNIMPFSEKISELNGLKYEELPDKVRRRFDRYEISFITLTQFEPSEPAELFDRLNQPMKLTSAEQRNAYIGETRNQIKELVNYFEELGASKETIGFSNSRLAYDEIIAKFCYAIEIETLRQKIIASDISEKYRDNKKFSDDTVLECKRVLSDFISVVNDQHSESYHLKMNKATIYSWFVFIKQNKSLSIKEISNVIFSFEIIRDYLKGKLTVKDDFHQKMITQYEILKSNVLYLEAMVNIFNQRASMGSTDALSVIYRDIILYVFSCLINHDDGNSVLVDFNDKAIKSVSNALEFIYEKYKWGEMF